MNLVSMELSPYDCMYIVVDFCINELTIISWQVSFNVRKHELLLTHCGLVFFPLYLS
jgi:hypothetical protein